MASQQTDYDVDHFLIDWEKQQATCPEGHTSSSWTPAIDNRKNEVIRDPRSPQQIAESVQLVLCVPSQFATLVAP
ncbi:MAG TPA: hypothetical protein VFB12_23470 [Ktedonobacteraceae bacterium]|nr:hypothetical protein [Ktedonobacteraceae bacterium]